MTKRLETPDEARNRGERDGWRSVTRQWAINIVSDDREFLLALAELCSEHGYKVTYKLPEASIGWLEARAK